LNIQEETLAKWFKIWRKMKISMKISKICLRKLRIMIK